MCSGRLGRPRSKRPPPSPPSHRRWPRAVGRPTTPQPASRGTSPAWPGSTARPARPAAARAAGRYAPWPRRRGRGGGRNRAARRAPGRRCRSNASSPPPTCRSRPPPPEKTRHWQIAADVGQLLANLARIRPEPVTCRPQRDFGDLDAHTPSILDKYQSICTVPVQKPTRQDRNAAPNSRARSAERARCSTTKRPLRNSNAARLANSSE